MKKYIPLASVTLIVAGTLLWLGGVVYIFRLMSLRIAAGTGQAQPLSLQEIAIFASLWTIGFLVLEFGKGVVHLK